MQIKHVRSLRASTSARTLSDGLVVMRLRPEQRVHELFMSLRQLAQRSLSTVEWLSDGSASAKRCTSKTQPKASNFRGV